LDVCPFRANAPCPGCRLPEFPEDDEDTAKAMARLFAEVGEAYVLLLATAVQEVSGALSAPREGRGAGRLAQACPPRIDHEPEGGGEVAELPEDDEYTAKAMARLFAEVVEAYVLLLAMAV